MLQICEFYFSLILNQISQMTMLSHTNIDDTLDDSLFLNN
jgi:hypothetical protein